MIYSAAIPSDIEAELAAHLLQRKGQEDLCFAIWYPSSGEDRYSALIHSVILPGPGDRHLHGNASVTGEYFERALGAAMDNGGGLAFIHSHLGPGWQDMSTDDIDTELSMAAQSKSATGFPLLGLTIGTDRSWSARFWQKTGPSSYQRTWCSSVRVLGIDGLRLTYCDHVLPPPKFRKELERTVSAWSIEKQQTLARLRVGVIGVGSVGSMVAEMLARMGICEITLIDFDIVERHNLDRLLHTTRRDYLLKRRKVDVIADAIQKSATADNFKVNRVPYSVTEDVGYRAALDCDVLFSCVDRPWGRYVLNLIAYEHLIPVVDGGIVVTKTPTGALQGADWQAHIAMPTRKCLECLGQYDPGFVDMERKGHLDDPSYIQSLPDDHILKRNENVFPFSASVASLEVLQFLSLAVRPLGITDVGTQHYHFVTGTMDVELGGCCHDYCIYPALIAKGDCCGVAATGIHLKAVEMRATSQKWNSLKARLLGWLCGLWH